MNDKNSENNVKPDNQVEIEKKQKFDEAFVSEEKAEITVATESNARTSVVGYIHGLVSVSLLAVVSLGGYLGYQQFHQISQRLTTLETTRDNSQSMANQLNENLTRQLNLQKQEIDKILQGERIQVSKKINEILTEIATTRRSISAVSGRHQSDWLLAEADYLVRIATNRLLLEEDHLTALALLLNADDRLLKMDDPSMQNAREALSRDIAKLRLINKKDVAGTAARLGALLPQLNSLPVSSLKLPEETVELVETDVSQSAKQTWIENLKNAMKELSVKWFEVRDHGRPVSPIMDPQFEQLIRNNLSLLLQTAQFAVLRTEAELYVTTMLQLKNLASEYFDNSDQKVVLFLTEIDKLASIQLNNDLPETLESRLVISREVESRLQKQSTSVLGETDSAGETL